MAFNFSGTGQYLSRTSAPVTAVPLTLAGWFNPDNVTASVITLAIDDGTANNTFALQLAGSFAGDPVRALSNGGALATAATSTSYLSGVWQHAAAVFRSSTDRSAYLNGGGRGDNATSSTPSGVSKLGVGGRSAGTNLLAGRAAECGIWSAALDDSELASLAAGYSPLLVRPTSLVFYWPGVRDLLTDLKGAPLTSTGPPTVADHYRIIYPRCHLGAKFVAPVVGGSVFTPYFYREHIARAA